MSSSYIIWDVLSSLLLGACGLSPLVVGNEANRYIRRSMDQVKSVVIMARIPGAVVKSVPWPSGTLDLTPDQKLQRFRLPTRVSSGQGSVLIGVGFRPTLPQPEVVPSQLFKLVAQELDTYYIRFYKRSQ